MNTLQQQNVKTIITAAEGFDHLTIDPSIKHITYPLLDSKTENIASFFEQSYHNIEQSLARGGVLLHCAAGISRVLLVL
jgi:protein-tyrosine phosphatase